MRTWPPLPGYLRSEADSWEAARLALTSAQAEAGTRPTSELSLGGKEAQLQHFSIFQTSGSAPSIH